MNYDLILFDLDDTIFDFGASQLDAIGHTITMCGLTVSAKIVTEFIEINNDRWKKFERGQLSKREVLEGRFQELFTRNKHQFDCVEANNIFLSRLTEKPILLEDAEEVCFYLKSKYSLGIITNGDSVTQRKRINASPLSDVFKFVAISDEIGFSKPHRSIFEHAFTLSGLSCDFSRVLMVGDNLFADIIGAQNFGFHTCWFKRDQSASSGKVKPTLTIAKLKELSVLL